MGKNQSGFLLPLKALGILLLGGLLGGCQASSYDRSHPAVSMDETRIRSIVIHYTQEEDDRSLEVLTAEEYPVSSHYLLSSKEDGKKPKIYQLVKDEARAWHAGVSGWRNRTNLNDTSIGIEIVYTIACDDGAKSSYETCTFPDFHPEQIDVLIDLLGDLTKKYPSIQPLQIIGHSDIAPVRKIDPGPRFPWQYLYSKGFGAWYDEAAMLRYLDVFKGAMPSPDEMNVALEDIGYNLDMSFDVDDEKELNYVIKAFQAHFVPHRISGVMDPLTAAVLFALREKYGNGTEGYETFCAASQICAD